MWFYLYAILKRAKVEEQTIDQCLPEYRGAKVMGDDGYKGAWDNFGTDGNVLHFVWQWSLCEIIYTRRVNLFRIHDAWIKVGRWNWLLRNGQCPLGPITWVYAC